MKGVGCVGQSAARGAQPPPAGQLRGAAAALEVHSEVERQAAVVRSGVDVVEDARQAEVEGLVTIEFFVAHAASEAQSAVEPLEGLVGERAERLALLVVLHLAAHAAG